MSVVETASLTPLPSKRRSLADLLHDLGDILPDRIRERPAPGTATKQDLKELVDREKCLCELIDGVLVEKAMGARESFLAAALIRILSNYVTEKNLGLVGAPDATFLLFDGVIRMPDVCFLSWERVPSDKVLDEEFAPEVAPDIAVEILSRSNTPREMERKRREYFRAGVRLVWEIDRKARTVTVYTTADQAMVLNESQTLIAESVLPGFALPLRELFAEPKRR